MEKADFDDVTTEQRFQFLTSCCVLRFCLSETSCPQEDNYPNGLCIKVNGKLFPLPVSTQPRRTSTL